MENHTNNVRLVSSSFYQNTVGVQLQACAGFCELENLTVTDNTMIGIHIFTTGGSDADINIRNSTIYHNGSSSYQNLRFDSLNSVPAQLFVKNSILASGGSGAPNCTLNADALPLTHFTATIVDDLSCGSGSTPGLISGDPQLASLANNGGFTLTRAPSLTSPAVDAGDNASCLNIDQRGLPRPVNKLGGGALCDIGAVELQ